MKRGMLAESDCVCVEWGAVLDGVCNESAMQ